MPRSRSSSRSRSPAREKKRKEKKAKKEKKSKKEKRRRRRSRSRSVSYGANRRRSLSRSRSRSLSRSRSRSLSRSRSRSPARPRPTRIYPGGGGRRAAPTYSRVGGGSVGAAPAAAPFVGPAPRPPAPPRDPDAPARRPATSGILSYVRAATAPRNGGLADDVLDPARQGVLEADDAIFGRNNRLNNTSGSAVADKWSRGVKGDRASERTFPYACKHCGSRYLAAPQLSAHLLEAHGERLHASLIRPAAHRGVDLDE